MKGNPLYQTRLQTSHKCTLKFLPIEFLTLFFPPLIPNQRLILQCDYHSVKLFFLVHHVQFAILFSAVNRSMAVVTTKYGYLELTSPKISWRITPSASCGGTRAVFTLNFTIYSIVHISFRCKHCLWGLPLQDLLWEMIKFFQFNELLFKAINALLHRISHKYHHSQNRVFWYQLIGIQKYTKVMKGNPLYYFNKKTK